MRYATLVCALALAACGGGGEAPPVVKAAPEAAQPTATPTNPEPPAPEATATASPPVITVVPEQPATTAQPVNYFPSGPLQNCGSVACPAGTTDVGTPHPAPHVWQPGEPAPIGVNMTIENVTAYNAWCRQQPAGTCTLIGNL